MRRVAPLVLVALAVAACARQPASPAVAPQPATPLPGPTTDRSTHVSLEFIDARVVPGGTHLAAAGGAEFGGLSACAMDASGDILAVSDDRERPSLFRLSLSLGAEGLRVTPLSATSFELRADRRGAPGVLDVEGMALVGSRLLLSNEGDEGTGVPPSLLEYEQDGRFVGEWMPAPAFLPARGLPEHGLRGNLAFEGLTLVRGGHLLMAAEAPTVQDGALPAIGRGAWGRWLEMIPDAHGWRPGSQFAYPIDPLPVMPGVAVEHQETGVSELLALGPDRVLALERGFVRTTGAGGFNVIRIYDVSLAGAADIAGVASLAGAQVQPLRKALVADLDEWKPRLGPQLGSLANFEAMCLGPTLPDGGRTLLLISDNNFRPSQLMVFALLRLHVR